MVRKILALLLLPLLTLGSERDQDSRPSYYNATVKIGGCTGVIIKTGPEVSVGISAQHCTPEVGAITSFTNPDGTGGYARWVSEDTSSDLSLFKVWSKDTKRVMAAVMPDKEKVAKECEGWGYPKGRGPRWKKLEYEGKFHITSLKAERFQFRVMDGDFNNGDSGGGVYCNGKLIGITSHGSEKHKHLFSCTKSQLNAFLKKNSDKLSAGEVEWDGSRVPPLDSDKDRTIALKGVIERLSKMESENEKLREIVRRIANTPTRVQILDPVSGKVLADESYPLGTPIRLLLPEIRRK